MTQDIHDKIISFSPELNKRISDERIKHMHGVAELMYKYADKFGIDEKDSMYLLGLIHDIGYVNGKENHELYGSCIPGISLQMGHIIWWHGKGPEEYKQFNKCSDEEIPKELILLWWADMMVDSGKRTGEAVGFEGRLKSLEERYGKDCDAYKGCKRTMEWIIEHHFLDWIGEGER